MTATAAQVERYVDTTGLISSQVDDLITDADAIITGRLDGSSMNTTLFDAIVAIQAAVFVGNRDPSRVRTGQFDRDAPKQVERWKEDIEISLRYSRTSSVRTG